MRVSRCYLATILLLAALVPAGARAQQPARQWEPRGFDFTPDGVWRARARAIMSARAAALGRGDFSALNAGLLRSANLTAGNGPTCGNALVVCGTLYEPIFLVNFKNTDLATLHGAAEYTDSLLGTGSIPGRPYTVRTFY